LNQTRLPSILHANEGVWYVNKENEEIEHVNYSLFNKAVQKKNSLSYKPKKKKAVVK